MPERNSFTDKAKSLPKKLMPIALASFVVSGGFGIESLAAERNDKIEFKSVPEFGMDHDTFVTDCVQSNFSTRNLRLENRFRVQESILLTVISNKSKKEKNTQSNSKDSDQQNKSQIFSDTLAPEIDTIKLTNQIIDACKNGTKPIPTIDISKLNIETQAIINSSQAKAGNQWIDNVQEVLEPENWNADFREHYEKWLYPIKFNGEHPSPNVNWGNVRDGYLTKTLVPFSHFHKLLHADESMHKAKTEEGSITVEQLTKLRELGNTRNADLSKVNELKEEIKNKIDHFEISNETEQKVKEIIQRNIIKLKDLAKVKDLSEAEFELKVIEIQTNLKQELLDIYNELPFETMNPTIARMDANFDFSYLKFVEQIPELTVSILEIFVLEELLEVLLITFLVLGFEGIFSSMAKLLNFCITTLPGLASLEAILTGKFLNLIAIGLMGGILQIFGGFLMYLCEMIDPVWRLALQIPCTPITYPISSYYKHLYFPTLRRNTYVKEFAPEISNARLNFFPELFLDKEIKDRISHRVECEKEKLEDPNNWDLSSWRKEQYYIGNMQLLEMLEHGMAFELGSSGPSMLYMCCLLIKNQMTTIALNSTYKLAKNIEYGTMRGIWELTNLHEDKTIRGNLLDFESADINESEQKNFRKQLRSDRKKIKPVKEDAKIADIVFGTVSEIRFWSSIIKCNVLLGWMQIRSEEQKKSPDAKPDWNEVVANHKEGKVNNTNTNLRNNFETEEQQQPESPQISKLERLRNDMKQKVGDPLNNMKDTVKGKKVREQYNSIKNKIENPIETVEEIRDIVQKIKIPSIPKLNNPRSDNNSPPKTTDIIKLPTDKPPNKFL